LIRIQLIDDDRWILEMFESVLDASIPGIQIMKSLTPEVIDGCDAYIVDNEMDGLDIGMRLVQRINDRNPDALVLAFSGTVSRLSLKALINAGCRGVGDKTRPEDLGTMSEIVKRFSDQRTAERSDRGIRGTVDSIRQLVREWNRRMGQEESFAPEAAAPLRP
jgi:DNA-binding NarL/FixJ family response regulator